MELSSRCSSPSISSFSLLPLRLFLPSFPFLFHFFSLRFLPVSFILLERTDDSANERLISRVKLLALTAAISTNTLARSRTTTQSAENGISFLLRSSCFPPPTLPLLLLRAFRSGMRSYFRHNYYFYCYSPLSARKEPSCRARARC